MADADLSPFPKFDLSKYAWRFTSKDGVTRAERLIAGGEILELLWNTYLKGDQNLFFGLYIQIANPVNYSDLVSAARETWGWLRFHIPTIAATTAVNDKDEGILVYNVANSQQDVDSWIARTFLEDRVDSVDLDELRTQLCTKKIPDEHGDQSFLHIVTGKASDSIDTFGLLFHVDHTPFDGAAMKKMSNRYLRRLAETLSNADVFPKENLKWGSEGANLVPNFFNAIDVSREPLPIPPSSSALPKNSDPYYQKLGAFIAQVARGPQTDYGFKPLPGDPGQPITRRQHVLFSKEESDLVLSKLKPGATVGSQKKGYTVAQLAHTALCMVTVADNPPTSEAKDRSINGWGLVDSTYRMKEPWSSREAFPGYALSATFMEFPIKLFLNEDGTPAPLNKDTFVKTLKYAKHLYTFENPRPTLLAFIPQAMEVLCGHLKAGFVAGAIPPVQTFNFANDGLGETYLDPVHFDSNGRPVLEINNFFTSLNITSPAGFYRVSSWKGIMELGVDENSNIIFSKESTRRLEQWKKFMLLIKDLEEKDYD